MDDFDYSGSRVLVRVDINSPVDPHTGRILDDTRMRLHSKTLKELVDENAKVAILAHQSRPGKRDFTTMEEHSKVLSNILDMPVTYVEDIFGCAARESIRNMENGDIILLENVRFYSEEVLKRDPKVQAETHLVRKLSSVVDYYINDAFAAAHRSQPSLVGFPLKLPSAAGRLMEREVKTLYKIIKNVEKPCVYILGGVKIDDSIMIMKNILKNGSADYILTSGLVANVFLEASGIDIKEKNRKILYRKNYKKFIKMAKKLKDKYGEKILTPVDVAINKNGKRIDVPIDDIPNFPIYDIGMETIKIYAEKIREAKTIFANGPAGVFEEQQFSIGTEDLLNAIASSNAFSVIAGGHLAAAAEKMGISNKINHISSGGGACIAFLSGEELPAIKVLEEARKRSDKYI
nr:phosphoglycerate kinase [Methanothermus fervidus]